jgi:hypothetical protein
MPSHAPHDGTRSHLVFCHPPAEFLRISPVCTIVVRCIGILFSFCLLQTEIRLAMKSFHETEAFLSKLKSFFRLNSPFVAILSRHTVLCPLSASFATFVLSRRDKKFITPSNRWRYPLLILNLLSTAITVQDINHYYCEGYQPLIKKGIFAPSPVAPQQVHVAPSQVHAATSPDHIAPCQVLSPRQVKSCRPNNSARATSTQASTVAGDTKTNKYRHLPTR